MVNCNYRTFAFFFQFFDRPAVLSMFRPSFYPVAIAEGFFHVKIFLSIIVVPSIITKLKAVKTLRS